MDVWLNLVSCPKPCTLDICSSVAECIRVGLADEVWTVIQFLCKLRFSEVAKHVASKCELRVVPRGTFVHPLPDEQKVMQR